MNKQLGKETYNMTYLPNCVSKLRSHHWRTPWEFLDFITKGVRNWRSWSEAWLINCQRIRVTRGANVNNKLGSLCWASCRCNNCNSVTIIDILLIFSCWHCDTKVVCKQGHERSVWNTWRRDRSKVVYCQLIVVNCESREVKSFRCTKHVTISWTSLSWWSYCWITTNNYDSVSMCG